MEDTRTWLSGIGKDLVLFGTGFAVPYMLFGWWNPKLIIIAILFSTVANQLMEHHDPKVRLSMRRRTVWAVVLGIAFLIMCLGFTWLRTGTMGF
jgi:hypothetical protein